MRYPTCDADVEDASPSGAEVTVHVRDGLYLDHWRRFWSQVADDPGALAVLGNAVGVLRVHRTHVPWIWSRPHA